MTVRLSPAGPLDISDTIVAQATPVGRGALAIVRLSGRRAHALAKDALTRWPDTPRTALLATVHDPAGTALDQVIVVRYDAPESFTGEDAVELSTHGGLVVPTTIVAALIARGARLALPGEFTRRALLNGKLDILQAEATADLIDADSRAAQQVALRQLDGGLSRRVLALRDAMIGLEALIAYDIDFPEEDDGPVMPARILAEADALIAALETLLATARGGELVRRGALVVLAGAPNVGKSSLFNALIGERRAIVTDIPGTTRDAIEAVIDTPTLPLRIVDTAGMRDALDPVERLGVEVSESYVARAAVVLACWDNNETARAIGSALAGRVQAPLISVRTKSDVLSRDAVEPEFDAHSPSAPEIVSDGGLKNAQRTIAVSAEAGAGLDELIEAIEDVVSRDGRPVEMDAPLLTQERHRFGVSRALEEMRSFREAWHTGQLPAPIAAVHLREAVTALEDLIGAVDVEDVLDEVFRRFCVGK